MSKKTKNCKANGRRNSSVNEFVLCYDLLPTSVIYLCILCVFLQFKNNIQVISAKKYFQFIMCSDFDAFNYHLAYYSLCFGCSEFQFVLFRVEKQVWDSSITDMVYDIRTYLGEPLSFSTHYLSRKQRQTHCELKCNHPPLSQGKDKYVRFTVRFSLWETGCSHAMNFLCSLMNWVNILYTTIMLAIEFKDNCSCLWTTLSWSS